MTQPKFHVLCILSLEFAGNDGSFFATWNEENHFNNKILSLSNQKFIHKLCDLNGQTFFSTAAAATSATFVSTSTTTAFIRISFAAFIATFSTFLQYKLTTIMGSAMFLKTVECINGSKSTKSLVLIHFPIETFDDETPFFLKILGDQMALIFWMKTLLNRFPLLFMHFWWEQIRASKNNWGISFFFLFKKKLKFANLSIWRS